MQDKSDAPLYIVTGHLVCRNGIRCERRRAFSHLLRLIGCVVPLLVCLTGSAYGATDVVTGLPGVWLMKPQVAVQMFECDGMMCGRVIWLQAPLDSEGLLKRDKLNPDPALRNRQACGQTIIWALRAADPNRWENGWFYNPDDGKTYRLNVELESPNQIKARIYVGIPILGVTKTLVRIPREVSEGWC